jgi:hypothetical protein
MLWIPLALVAALATSPVAAQTLLVQRVERAKSSLLPRAGATMAAVEAQFGAPEGKRDAVGKPPITRWEYPAFIVYFENDRVINAVVKKSSAEEVGPKPAPAQHHGE